MLKNTLYEVSHVFRVIAMANLAQKGHLSLPMPPFELFCV
jgi:hypothetical protein